MQKEKSKKQQIIHLICILLFAYVATNCFIIHLCYKSYNQSIDILAEIATMSEKKGMDMVSDLLKQSQTDSVEQGRQILEYYGYMKPVQNSLYESFTRKCLFAVIITFGFYVLLFFLLMAWREAILQKARGVLLQTEKMIENFRENDFRFTWDTDNQKEQDKMKYQLEKLGNNLKLLKEEARLEREGTKELVSDISHQLKTPVAALDACFSVLLNGDLDKEEEVEFQTRCRNALDGLEILLQSLLEISKMEAGLIQIEKKNFLLLETIIISVNRVYPKAAKKNIELVFDYDDEFEDYKIMQDKKWLSEAFINVLDNAVKYSSQDSEVVVRVRKRMGFARIEIEDQGIGIPKEEYHKIFQRFFRGSQPVVKEASGSGIGLFLARKIIEGHHGTITVSSRIENKDQKKNNSGSVFIIQLPDNE